MHANRFSDNMLTNTQFGSFSFLKKVYGYQGMSLINLPTKCIYDHAYMKSRYKIFAK